MVVPAKPVFLERAFALSRGIVGVVYPLSRLSKIEHLMNSYVPGIAETHKDCPRALLDVQNKRFQLVSNKPNSTPLSMDLWRYKHVILG